MSPDSETTKFHHSVPKALTSSAAGTFAALLLNLPPDLASGQQLGNVFANAQTSSQGTPPVIPEFSIGLDPSGLVATYQPGGSTQTSSNAFFQSLGTNGRTCFTCHQPQTGWTVSAAAAQARFYASAGMDPLFRPVDGATCPTDDVSTFRAKQQAYQLLTGKGLIRIAIQLPPNQFTNNLQFEVSNIDDPYGCTSLTSKTSGTLSMYRRPLPATNLGFGFVSTPPLSIMWDGREPSLAQQSIDATTGHAEANAAPSTDQQDQIVSFESGIFTAQIFDFKAGNLNAAGASGGPVALSFEVADFFKGINDPLGSNPKGTPFNPNIFDLYKSPRWSDDRDEDATPQRESIARGEVLFNTTQINITGVAGLNDVLGMSSIPGFCGTCHDTPNVGNHSVKLPLNIGIANAGANSPPALDISGLPVFTLKCTAGPLAGQTFVVTDPGRALITGNCADIGKVKGPILRGLAARAPYFHNGSAATLMDAVNFYDQRFNIGFTDQQKQDLVNFLNAL